MSKKKEIELEPGAEKWVADEEARFDAEVAGANDDDDERLAKAQAEAEEEEEMMNRFSDGPEGDEPEEDEDEP